MNPIAPILFAALILVASAASAQQSPPVPGSIHVTPQNFQLPEGGSCSGEISRYRAIQDNDLAMGHVAKSVYNQIKVDIAGAERECAAGHDAKSRSMITASKERHGYPTGL